MMKGKLLTRDVVAHLPAIHPARLLVGASLSAPVEPSASRHMKANYHHLTTVVEETNTYAGRVLSWGQTQWVAAATRTRITPLSSRGDGLLRRAPLCSGGHPLPEKKLLRRWTNKGSEYKNTFFSCLGIESCNSCCTGGLWQKEISGGGARCATLTCHPQSPSEEKSKQSPPRLIRVCKPTCRPL